MLDGRAVQPGLVISSFGRHVSVETPDGRLVTCHPRGKRNQAVVGDRVSWLASADQGTIESIEKRRNLFFRQDEVRIKSFAANLDQILILIAARPSFSEAQLAHALIAAEAQGIHALIALNKQDLSADFALAWRRLETYRRMGYQVLPLSLMHGGEDELQGLLQQLDGKATLVLGPSGSGKSSLINRLIPGAMVRTEQISEALNAGRHTTTRTTWHWLDRSRGCALIDSPGFQAFGLHHLDPMALAACLPDFRPYLEQCRFHNCTHLHEPGCGVLRAIADTDQNSGIASSRHRLYASLFTLLSQAPRY